MLPRVMLVVVLTIGAAALLSDSAAGGWLHRSCCQPCHPCPASCTPCCHPQRMYRLYFCTGDHWALEGSEPSDYHSLYLKGLKAHRRPRHHTEGCHFFADEGSFTIAPIDTIPSDLGSPAPIYILWYCQTGGWTYHDANKDYNTLYQEGMNDHRMPLDCSETCPGGYADYFTICPTGIHPGGYGGCCSR